MAPDHGDLSELLIAEHAVIAELLDALAAERHDRFPLAHRLIDELAAHTAAEQFLFYPALRDIVPGGIAMADRAQVEHRAMRRAMEALERSHPGDAAFEDALVELTAEVKAHVPTEESQLRTLEETIGADKMAELAVLYTQVKQSLPSGLQSLSPDLQEPEFRPW